MAKKEVWLNVPSQELGTMEVEFKVWSGGKRYGTLRISKASIVWFPAMARYGKRLSWGRFNMAMNKFGRDERKRK